MGNFIKCGTINRAYKYILFYLLFLFLNDFLYKLNYNETFYDFNIYKIFSEQLGENNKIYKHYFFHQLINYFFTFLFGSIFYKIEVDSSKTEGKKSFIQESNNLNKKGKLIYLNNTLENKSFKLAYQVLLIIFFWFLEEQLLYIFQYAYKHIDFWMVELLIIAEINSKMFNKKIYIHQWLAIFLNLILVILKAGTIIISYFDKNNFKKNENKNENIPILYIYTFLIIGLVFYFILVLLV